MNKLILPSEHWLQLGLAALYAAAGAGLTYLTQHATGQDFGTLTPLVIAGLTALSGYLHKIVTVQPTPKQ